MVWFLRVTDKRPDAAIDQLIAAVAADARVTWNLNYEGQYPKTGFGITNLRARDVTFTNQVSGLQGNVAGSAVWGVTAVTVSTWTDWINIPIDDRCYQIVTGIFNRSSFPSITHMRMRINGEDQAQMCLEPLYTWDQPHAWLEKPYAVRPAANHTVRLLTERTIAGVPAEKIGLLGYTVGKRTFLIAES